MDLQGILNVMLSLTCLINAIVLYRHIKRYE